MRVLLIAAALVIATPANAAPASQRVSILKYYQCLAQQVFYTNLLCHL